jgi:hypothetical protein
MTRRAAAAYSARVATWDEVHRIAMAMPEAVERSPHDWRVKGKGFVSERPLRKADLLELGADAPDGPILGVRVADVGVKEALLADDPDVYFTTSHFDGYAMILARLDRIGSDELEELVVESWLVQAPKRLAKQYLDGQGAG